MSDAPKPPALEARAIQLVQELREAAGWSQTELARRMVEAGWPNYTQMTVSRTEKGERPIRLNEAASLAEVLGIRLADLWMDEDEQLWQHYLSRASEKANDVAHSIAEYGDATRQLAFTADELAKKGSLDSARDSTVRDMIESTPAELFWKHRVDLLRDRQRMDQRVVDAGGHPDELVTRSLGGEYSEMWTETYMATPDEADEYESELRDKGIEVDDA
jgi:transcriptional regulator with XRE-family HTH domain